ncbi:MAG: cbb3-type cytochrome c oxidase subunit I [Cytophagales bacterium]
MKLIFTTSIVVLLSLQSFAQNASNIIGANDDGLAIWLLIIVCFSPLVILIVILFFKLQNQVFVDRQWRKIDNESRFSMHIKSLNQSQILQFITMKNKSNSEIGNNDTGNANGKNIAVGSLFLLSSSQLFAQSSNVEATSLLSQPGIIITLFLIAIPILLGAIFAMMQVNNLIKKFINKSKRKEAEKFAEYLQNFDNPALETELEKRKKVLDYNLTNQELSGNEKAEDTKGTIINVSDKRLVNFTEFKKKAAKRPILEPDITKLILWYCGCATFWLVVGTGIGEYLGIKFVAPDVDHISWLSFGRLRPTHTNIVFWGWASIGLIGLGYYVVPTVSNTKIYSIKWGWIALILTNLMVILGTICLMSGFNNGGGEFREYVWPVMALFAVALILTLANFLLTVAKRTTEEIYISNWYIVSSIIFTIIVAVTAYLPFWQDGVSETIVQGYFMHSGVGMWFTLFTLGLLYYFIPQQINLPIYAYSLGILAFWTQIIFYTIIGTHHFVFAPLPWWLQTVAIVGSAGMIIPVVAATINFSMTFKGQMHKVSHSYTLPFFLVAVVYYFMVSLQGTAEAFKFTNLLWHFTDFTVAHAHLGFYGIISFTLWGGMYAIIPRLTGKEPSHSLVGAHFWLAFIGLLFYAIPLSYGATLRGLMWMEGKPFIESVVLMFEYWLWRAIGGSLMFVSHLVFLYNFYKMTAKEVEEVDIKEEAFRLLKTQA